VKAVTERDRKIGNGWSGPTDELDRKLDAALSKYAAVEPRDGLEERILAGLRQPAQVMARAWWRWEAVVVSAIVIVAVILAWRVEKPSHPAIANHRAVDALHSPTYIPQPDTTPKAQPLVPTAEGHHRITSKHRLVAVTVTVPKLEQFPSPRPLSEQEKLALEYVQRFPKEAVLMARAQTARAQEEQNENNLLPAEDWPGEGKQ
jgi:hypothetical protein